MKRLCSIGTIALLLCVCGFSHGDPAEDNLTRAQARERKAQINAVDYDVHIKLAKGKDGFDVITTINAELKKTSKVLRVDLIAKEIAKVAVNGTEIKDFRRRDSWLEIPEKYLAPKTTIEITHSGEFGKEGNGFQKSIDPVDKSEYIYTDFEPFYAHQLIPCFDQPDLKGTFALTVEAPTEWKVIGNELVEKVAPAGKESTLTTFKRTPKISTYLFFVGAGPFKEWKKMAGKIPMYIWARKSLAKFVDAERMFQTTAKGLEFYQNYFGFAYPFSKYGQVFIPEFAWGGMENPGAVTLNERGIFRGPVSKATLLDRDNLILHEMAHMWFGDLVTMEWWNDLWLNESFASYLATVAEVRAIKQNGAQLEFFSDKGWGYWQDQLVTTHPIETEVPDIRTAKGNFDGITYAKGASALKQLHFLVGDEGFRKGLASYFSKYAFGNTEREDFIAEIAKASGTDLEKWTKRWLQTSGPNRVRISYKCSEDESHSVIESAEIIQKPSSSKTLSPHRAQFGLFNLKKDRLSLTKEITVQFEKEVTPVPELAGVACPDFVMPNMNDHDYALYSIDEQSMANVGLILNGQGDALMRLMVWGTLGQMVRDGEFSVLHFHQLATQALKAGENDEILLGLVLGRHSQWRQFLMQYVTKEQREKLIPATEATIWERVKSAKPKSSQQITFFDFYLSLAQSDKALPQLAGFLAGRGVPPGIELDQDRRWRVVSALATEGYKGSDALIAAEEKRDLTTVGKRNAYAARASIPSLEVKRDYWNQFQKPKEIPFSNLRSAAGNFHHANHPELSSAFTNEFFDRVKQMDWASNDMLVEVYFEELFPGQLCTQDLLNRSQKELGSTKQLTSLAKRAWLEQNDELARCVSVREQTKKMETIITQ